MKTTGLTTQHKLVVLPHLTIPTNLVDRRTKYHSQASHLVRPHHSFCLYANTRIGHLRNNFRTFTNRLNFLWFLNMVFFLLCFFFFLFLFLFYSCIINFIITIFLSLFLPSSLSLLFLYYSPLFSLTTTLSAPSHALFPLSSPPPHPPPTCHHTTLLSYTLTTC
jgi:glycosyltransferase involved in cell wall biosynthesis